jgi:hypothetical protein
MNAVHRAGIDRFLNSIGAVAILTNGSGTTEMGLNNESIGGDMGAITATNTNGLIHPHGLIPELTTQQWFQSIRLNGMNCWSRKSKRWISQG